MRRRIMAANWKMYKNAQQTAAFFNSFNPLVRDVRHCETVIFPNSLCISAAVEAVRNTNVQIGGQNIYWKREGAFTGEISAHQLADAGACWVLVGHSERRNVFCEKDGDVLRKATAALEAGLQPIVCVGERLDEHESGKWADVLVRQFAGGAAGLTEEQFARIAIAYEPVWAIGTGQTATPETASTAHRVIREEAEKRFGSEAANSVRILYGGSVKPENIHGLMASEEIDGVLVGGASLDPESFSKIVHAA